MDVMVVKPVQMGQPIVDGIVLIWKLATGVHDQAARGEPTCFQIDHIMRCGPGTFFKPKLLVRVEETK